LAKKMSFQDWVSGDIERLASDIHLRRPSPHQSIFKYVGLNTKRSWDLLERTLSGCELSGSTFNALNDPFELTPHLFNDLRPSTIAAAVGYQGLSNRLKKLPSEPEEVFSDIGKYEADARKHFEQMQRDARIIAFCDRSDSPLLWSHYAHSYGGACLHFAGRAFRGRETKFGYVTYSAHRPIYPLSLALALSSRRSADADAALRHSESDRLIFFTKAADWAYEREVRIVHSASRDPKVPFQADGLLSVIIGPRMKPEDQAKLRDVIARSQVPRVPVRFARLSTNSFSVEIE